MLILLVVNIVRGETTSKYYDFRLKAPKSNRAFVIIQINNIDSEILNDARIYIDCNRGPKTYVRPALSTLLADQTSQVG